MFEKHPILPIFGYFGPNLSHVYPIFKNTESSKVSKTTNFRYTDYAGSPASVGLNLSMAFFNCNQQISVNKIQAISDPTWNLSSQEPVRWDSLLPKFTFGTNSGLGDRPPAGPNLEPI